MCRSGLSSSSRLTPHPVCFLHPTAVAVQRDPDEDVINAIKAVRFLLALVSNKNLCVNMAERGADQTALQISPSCSAINISGCRCGLLEITGPPGFYYSSQKEMYG